MELERGVGEGSWAVKNTSEDLDVNTCIVCVMHSGDIHSFIYAISFYIGLIMLISMSEPRNGSMSPLLMDFQLLGLF